MQAALSVSMMHTNSGNLFSGLQNDYHFTDSDFYFITEFIHKKAGIFLKAEKKPMVYSRLVRRVRGLNFTTFSDYVQHVQKPEGRGEIEHMVNALTTNLTRFFREDHHFDHLGKVVLKEAVEKAKTQGKKRLRLWSAGCSSGQEPYTLAMIVCEYLPNHLGFDVKILATDLDTQMVAHAEKGVYASDHAKEVPGHYRHKYCKTEHNGDLVMGKALRDLITFKPLNLLDPWPMQGGFDIIFCRNVVIYFNRETQAKIFNRYADALEPNGWLYIGHSESLHSLCPRFKMMGRTIYQKEK